MATTIKLKQLELTTSGYMIKANGSGIGAWVNPNTIALSSFNNDLNTGLVVGTSTITSGTNTRILYNNSGVLGEYLVTGTGTTAVLSTSPTISTSLQMDGVINIYDTTKTINGGLISQVSGAVLTFGANTGSQNLFGGSYTQAESGGIFQIDTRAASGSLFNWGGRAATVSAIGTTNIMTLTSTGGLTILPTTTSFLSVKKSNAGFMFDLYDNSTHQAMAFYGDNSAHGSIIRMFSRTTTNNVQLVGDGASGQKNFFLTAQTGFFTSSPTAYVHLGAGTATAATAPLKFTSGTNNTTAETGAMEYNGTNLFFTRSGTTREGVLTQSAVTTEVVVSDTTVTVNIGGVTYKLLARA